MDGSGLVRLAGGKLPGLGFGEAVLRWGEVVFRGGVPEYRWVRKGKEGCGQREIFKPR